MNARAIDAPLAGTRVLVTRPAAQCAGLAAAIEARGGEALVQPLVAIGPPAELERARSVLARIADFDLAIFVSRNAVERGLELARGDLPARAAALGRASAAALRAAGVAEVLAPCTGDDSESLLDRAELGEAAIRGRRVLIVKGEGGRALLAETLAARGALVEQADVYRRSRPADACVELLCGDRVDVIVITSAESLDNLLALAGENSAAALEGVAFVAISERVAQRIRAAGLGSATLVARRADDDSLADAVVEWRARERRRRSEIR